MEELGKVISLRLNPPKSRNETCRTFSAVAWCGKLNAIACAAKTCARTSRSKAGHPFWIAIHILNPERPKERPVIFKIEADSQDDGVQFIEWSPISSPTSSPRALLIANFRGRVTVYTQLSQGPSNLVIGVSTWRKEYMWFQGTAVVTKWLQRFPRRLSAISSGSTKSIFEEEFLSQKPQATVCIGFETAGWANFLCVCSVFSSGSVQLHWSPWPPNQSGGPTKWFCTGNAPLIAEPSGIKAADAVVTDSGALHVAGVLIANPLTVIIWEVTPGPRRGFQATPKASLRNEVAPSVNCPSWDDFAPLTKYLFSWQEFFLLEEKYGIKRTEQDYSDMVDIHCSPVSNFSACMSPMAAIQSAATTRYFGVNAVAFDPARNGSVTDVVIAEGHYMSPCDPKGVLSVTGWIIERWESCVENVQTQQIFGNSSSILGGHAQRQTFWRNKQIVSFPAYRDITSSRATAGSAYRVDFDLPSDVKTLARIVYSTHDDHIAVAFVRGGVRIFSGVNFTPVVSYQYVGPGIAAPAFSSTSCCSAFVWHSTCDDCAMLKIIRFLPPPVPTNQIEANSAKWERAIANRFWCSIFVGVDWWDAVGCTWSAVNDGIVSLNGVIAVLDADFHSFPIEYRKQYGTSLDRIKCKLLEGTTAQEVRTVVLDMQARLLLDMLRKGIESALINPSALVPEPWHVSGEILSDLDHEAMAVEPTLIPIIQAYVDAVLDLALLFVIPLIRYARFRNMLASADVTAGMEGSQNMVTSPTQSTATPTITQESIFGNTTSSGITQIQAWLAEDISKICGKVDGVLNSAPYPSSGLIGDCHFLHQLCQLLLFCFSFLRIQLPSLLWAAKTKVDSSIGSTHLSAAGEVEATDTTRLRLGVGYAGRGYNCEEVRVLFLILRRLCEWTEMMSHPSPVSQVGSSNIKARLHYIDGNCTDLPEVALFDSHMLGPTLPTDADAEWLLLRDLELYPPSVADESNSLSYIRYGAHDLWARKRKISERDAPLELSTSSRLTGFRRDVVTTLWKREFGEVWYKCIRCLRRTSAFASPGSSSAAFASRPDQNEKVKWWISHWVYGCPMCGGTWCKP